MLGLLRQPLLKSIRIAHFGVKNVAQPIPRVLVRSYSYRSYLRAKTAGRLNHHPFKIPKIPNWVKTTMWLGLIGGWVSFSGTFWYIVLKIMMGESDLLFCS